MKRWGPMVACFAVVALGVGAWAGTLSEVPHEFSANTVARASEVNENFEAVVDEIDDNDARIDVLESDVFPLSAALYFMPGSNAGAELAAKAESAHGQAESRFNSGLAEAEEVCRWSKRWKDAAYLNASDDAGRLAALEAHADRIDDLTQDAYLRFDVGLLAYAEVVYAEHCQLEANALADGFAAMTAP